MTASAFELHMRKRQLIADEHDDAFSLPRWGCRENYVGIDERARGAMVSPNIAAVCCRGDRQGERDRKGTSEGKRSPCQSEKGRRRGQGQVVLRRLGEV